MSLPAVAGAVYAYANWGAWKADCPNPHCHSALTLDHGQQVFQCLECPAAADVVWPPNVADIEALLLLRPDFTNRNWLPGETLHDLLAENMAHGIVPRGWQAIEAPTPVPLLQIAGDRIVADELVSRQRVEIGG